MPATPVIAPTSLKDRNREIAKLAAKADRLGAKADAMHEAARMASVAFLDARKAWRDAVWEAAPDGEYKGNDLTSSEEEYP